MVSIPHAVRANARTVLIAVGLGLLAFAPAAIGHGLGAEDPNRPLPEYLWLGTKHLLAGWDHLLFIAAVVLVSGSLWRATKMLSLFVLGHSITLFLATMQEWTVSTAFVDIVIALSVVAVAAAGLSHREINWRLFGAGLFTFGLIHGLGLSTRLQELGVADNDLVWRVLLFNLGVEIGQAIAVLACAAIGVVIARTYTGSHERARRVSFTAIAVAGLIGTMILSFPKPEEPGSSEASLAAETNDDGSEACKVTDRDEPPQFAGGGHPERTFYAPGETYPEEDFIHVLYDGYIVVEYRPDVPEGDVSSLRELVTDGTEGMVAGPDTDQSEAVIAHTMERELRCSEIDAEALSEFRDDWIAEVTGQA